MALKESYRSQIRPAQQASAVREVTLTDRSAPDAQVGLWLAHHGIVEPTYSSTDAGERRGMMLPPVPPRSLVLRCAGIELVVRPAGAGTLAVIAAALACVYLPGSIPGMPALALTYSAVSGAVLLLLTVTILLHEAGHALVFRLHGISPVRITVRAGGAACGAIADDERPGQILVRALAGPAASALGLILLVLLWRALPPSSVWRVAAMSVATFEVINGLFNLLPTVRRCDGCKVLHAVLWLARKQEPDHLSVFYLWRPLVLAVVLASGLQYGAMSGFLAPGSPLAAGLALCALGLCAITLVTLCRLMLRRRPARG